MNTAASLHSHVAERKGQEQGWSSNNRHLRHRLKLDSLAFRQAESTNELEKAFSLVYASYQQKGFIPEPKEHGMFFSIYSLLPGTIHVMIRENQKKVISNLSAIPSSGTFGLPMDSIYKSELDRLRSRGRKVVELSALATSKKHRMHNIFLYQIQALYWYFIYNGVDDICVTVNPRHKGYYMRMFPFEELGPVRHYSRVNAPAVGLRARVYESLECMVRMANSLDLDRPFYRYLYELAGEKKTRKEIYLDSGDLQLVLLRNSLNGNALRYFLSLDPDIVKELNWTQIMSLENICPGATSILYSQSIQMCRDPQ